MIFQNKKADERYISPWLFLVWIIVGVAIIVGALMFLSVQVDIRSADATLLGERIVDCLENSFNYEEFSSSNFDFSLKCGFNKKVLIDSGLYYYNLDMIDSGDKVLNSIFGGVKNFKVMCDYVKSGKKESNFPSCYFNSFRVNDKKSGKSYLINLVTASNQK